MTKSAETRLYRKAKLDPGTLYQVTDSPMSCEICDTILPLLTAEETNRFTCPRCGYEYVISLERAREEAGK